MSETAWSRFLHESFYIPHKHFIVLPLFFLVRGLWMKPFFLFICCLSQPIHMQCGHLSTYMHGWAIEHACITIIQRDRTSCKSQLSNWSILKVLWYCTCAWFSIHHLLKQEGVHHLGIDGAILGGRICVFSHILRPFLFHEQVQHLNASKPLATASPLHDP